MKLILVPAVLGAAAVLAFAGLLYSGPSAPPAAPAEGFTYYDVESLNATFAQEGLYLSVPVAITDHTRFQYCPAVDGADISYCTTTSVYDSGGAGVANISLGGNLGAPLMALALVDAPGSDARPGYVEPIFGGMIGVMVCDCWAEEAPGGFESIGEWLDAAEVGYASSDEEYARSVISGLGDVDIVLEIGRMDDGSQRWTMLLVKQAASAQGHPHPLRAPF